MLQQAWSTAGQQIHAPSQRYAAPQDVVAAAVPPHPGLQQRLTLTVDLTLGLTGQLL
jgi:hypothetical protein